MHKKYHSIVDVQLTVLLLQVRWIIDKTAAPENNNEIVINHESDAGR